MWSPRRLGFAAVALALLGLSACQVRPLYGTGPQGRSPQVELPAIAIDPPVTRQEQLFRNSLNFALHGGSGAAPARYHMIYRLTVRETEVAVERLTGTPNSYQLNGSVSFLVRDIATGDEIFGANVTAIASYNRSTQSFANIRAERDAQERLVETMAQMVQARLAAFFATR